MRWMRPDEGGVARRSWPQLHMSFDGVPLLLRPGRGKADLLWGCVRRLVSWVKGSMRELRSVTLTSHSRTFSLRAHCCAASWSTWRRSHRSVLLPSTMTITWEDNTPETTTVEFWNYEVLHLKKNGEVIPISSSFPVKSLTFYSKKGELTIIVHLWLSNVEPFIIRLVLSLYSVSMLIYIIMSFIRSTQRMNVTLLADCQYRPILFFSRYVGASW